MKQPIIGIVPAMDEGDKLPQSRSTHYLRRTYTEVLRDIGSVPLILNIDMPIESVLELCDGIIISGGEDIDPVLYGEVPLDGLNRLREPAVRAHWEKDLVAAADHAGIPILGICYGMQLLNVLHGGTLYQNIPVEMPDAIEHEYVQHDVEFTDNFLGYSRGDVRTIESRHHQAVHDLADGFEVCAVAPDGLVEAIRKGRHFGMQWHPEDDVTGVHVYRAFVERCMPALADSLSTYDKADLIKA